MIQKVNVNDKIFTSYISAEEIQHANERLSKSLSEDYVDKKPLFIAILNGSFMFASDLFKQLNFPAEICFIKLASYKGTKSTGNVITSIGLDIDLHNRHVVLLEDIIDIFDND
jgi:hypoxanthine phosphoribosyltransferase